MKTYLLLTALVIILCLGMGCTAKRHVHTERRLELKRETTQARSLDQSQLDTWREVQHSNHLQQVDMLSLYPVGRVTFHPDSGFSGEFLRIDLVRQQTELHDSLHRVREQRSENRLHEDMGEVQQADVEYLRRSHTTLRSPGWSWIGLILLIAGGILIRKNLLR